MHPNKEAMTSFSIIDCWVRHLNYGPAKRNEKESNRHISSKRQSQLRYFRATCFDRLYISICDEQLIKCQRQRLVASETVIPMRKQNDSADPWQTSKLTIIHRDIRGNVPETTFKVFARSSMKSNAISTNQARYLDRYSYTLVQVS